MDVTIENSWMMNHMRYHKHFHDFKKNYADVIISNVFKQATAKDIGNPLTVWFMDNHYSNIDCLDYKKLHHMLSKFFSPVEFLTASPIDYARDPAYFRLCNTLSGARTASFIRKTVKQNISVTEHSVKKIFGLHILRPDVNRLGILIELYRRKLLDHVDIRIGFGRFEFGAIEYWRHSNIDLACLEFDISHLELIDLLDSLTRGDRNDATDNFQHRGEDHVDKDIEKNQLNTTFAIELVADSSFNNNIINLNEKIIRPMLLKQPFIVIGSPLWYNFYQYMGFKTFNNLWNESWDSLPAERIKEKISQIGSTCEYIVNNYTPKQIIELSSIITEYNYNILVNDKIVVPTVDELLDCVVK
jgi:hypothetical protein